MEDQEKRGPLDALETVAGAALAIGAGAALLYKGGVSNYLSDTGVKRFEKTLGNLRSEMSSMSLADYDYDMLKSMTKKYITDDKSVWKESINHVTTELESGIRKNNIYFDTTDKDSLPGIISSFLKASSDRQSFYRPLFTTEAIKKPLMMENQALANGNEEVESKIFDFINKAVDSPNTFIHHFDDEGRVILKQDNIDKVIGDSLTLEQQHDLMMNILKKVQDEDTDTGLKNFMDHNSTILEEFRDKVLGDELEKKMGSKNKDKFFDSVVQKATDDKATLDDILELRRNNEANRIKVNTTPIKSERGYNLADEDINSILDVMQSLVDRNPELGNMYVGGAIKKDAKGELYSVTRSKDISNKVIDEFANTIPGKVLKLREFLMPKEAPDFKMISGRVYDPILARSEGNGYDVISSNYLRIYNKTYKINIGSDNPLEHIEALDNTFLTSGEHGTISRMHKNIMGDTDRAIGPKNKTLQWLDMGKSADPTMLDEIRSFGKKFNNEDWGRNLVNYFFNAGSNVHNVATTYEVASLMNDKHSMDHVNEFVANYFNKVDKMNSWLRQSVDTLSKDSALKLSKNATHKDIFEMLAMTEKDMTDEVVKKYVAREKTNPFLNADLNTLIKRYIKDPHGTKTSFTIASNRQVIGNEVSKIDFAKQLRREIAKEGFLQEAKGGRYGAINQLIDLSDLPGMQKNTAYDLANWAMIQKEGNRFLSQHRQKTLNTRTEDLIRDMQNIQTLFSAKQRVAKSDSDNLFLEQFETNMKKFAKEKASILQKGFISDEKEIIDGKQYAQHIHIRKPVGLIEAINDSTKRKAFAKQFYAGRKNPEDITALTYLPYFTMFRLQEPLNKFNLGFSSESMGSSLDLAKNMMLKRVAPVIAGASALSYLDWRSQAYTGTSLKGYGANALATFDLGIRKINDVTGITSLRKNNRNSNVMSLYWNDDEDYQGHDERLQWYKSGYSPVRKGRWWSFGSTAEFRGTKISYYQPNYLINAHSNWKDIGIYGSTNEKWKHSWIPTPAHPLAPIRRLMDPYYLERKHYWDRPYPMSGKMFGEGTPWSGALNATVGRVLKPQIRMHRKELGSSMLDVRDLIARRNAEIKANASSNNSLIQVDKNGALTPVSFNPYAYATDNRAIYDVSIKNGKVRASLYGATPQSGLSYDALSFKDFGNNYQTGSYDNLTEDNITPSKFSSGSKGPGKLTLVGKLRTTPVIGEFLSPILNSPGIGVTAKAAIAEQNRQVYMKAAQQPKGVILPDTIYKEAARNSAGVLYNKEALADAKNMSNNKDYMNDALYSAQEVLGLYGFLVQAVAPAGKRHRLAQADKMTSFSRSFWDSNLGGWGGDVMEIARRFFPHDDHNNVDINPIRNTMPDWMPERFKHGDPYTSLPKGEMRLPGKGYENMYKLHSDQFGRYGAYDRMKILGDIAPYSQEFKVWRDIAQKSVTDPRLKADIENIKKRVSEQSKGHRFYDYRFLKSETTRQEAVIDKVKQSTFTILGSDHEFKLAGVKMTSKDALRNNLHTGMSIMLEVDKDKYKRINNDGTFNAAVLIDGEALGKKLVRGKQASYNKDDITAAGIHNTVGALSIEKGKLIELIAHYDMPFIHDKFMRVDSPLESYKRHHVYGNEYSSWDHPIKSMLIPSFQRTFSQGLGYQAIGLGTMYMAHKVRNSENTSKLLRASAEAAWMFTNRGAFAGKLIGRTLRPNVSTYSKVLGTAGSVIGLTGYAYTRLDNPIKSTFNFGLIGGIVGKQLFHDSTKGAKVGALVGLGLSALKNPGFDKEKMWGPWMPKKTKKRKEIEEYYDRLKYVKYMGLYNAASRKAWIKEGVNVKRILNKVEYDRKQIKKNKEHLLAKRSSLSNSYEEGSYNAIKDIDNALALNTMPEQVIKAGKYTKAALAYKYAADSTIYGLTENATWSQILRATPKEDRDYILEFAKEKDPKKRKKIEKYFSPYERKLLQTVWGDKVKKQESNSKFFKSHRLPGPFWAGWKPDVDLDNVQIKEIKNEGLMLSDFGFYESEAESPETKNAPTLNMKQQQSAIGLKKNLLTVLNGAGLTGVNISVEPTSEKGITMITNICRRNTYSLKEKVNGAMNRIF